MKRITVLIYFTILTIVSAFAVPAKPGIVTRTQSDGSLVSVEIIGDEFNHYTLADGIYTVLEDEVGDFCYATIKDNQLVSSGVKVRPSNRLNAEEKTVAMQSIGLRPIGFNPLFNREMHSPERAMASRIKEAAANAVEPNEQPLQIADWGGTVSGERNLLVILVEYSDKGFSITSPREKFYNLLNEEGYSDNGCNGSTRDYFVDASNGKFTPHFDVVGPYRLPQNRKYYGGNNAYGDDSFPAVQTVDACNLAEADGTDFSKYDNDGDGKIDLVFVVYAGHNEAEGGPAESVWPHQWDIYPGQNILQSTYPEYDGKKLVTYACSSELKGYVGSQMCNIGTFCHEFGHALGLPDWYDTDGQKNGEGLGLSWTSIMNSGNYLNDSRTPPTYNAIERWLLGWAFPKEIKDTGAYTITHISNDDSYIIWANDSKTECFLFESRVAAANNKWDKYLNQGYKEGSLNYQGGEGMLIYHLDWDSDVYSNWRNHSINGNVSHECARLFRANPTAGESSSKSWFFPGARNVTSLSYETTPKFQNWDKEKLPFYLDNITISGSNVVFHAMVKELILDVRQYDALIDWRAAKSDDTQWDVTCVCLDDASEEVIFNTTTSNKYVNVYPLNTDSKYAVNVYPKGSSDAIYELEISTQSNVIAPMSSLNLVSSHKSSEPIRLGVKNLDCTIQSLVWYVDDVVSKDAYITLSAGKHKICAAITDTEGNTEYLYRYITVQ